MSISVPEVSRSVPEGCAESRSCRSVASKDGPAEALRRSVAPKRRAGPGVFRGRSCKASGGPGLTAKLRRTSFDEIYIR